MWKELTKEEQTQWIDKALGLLTNISVNVNSRHMGLICYSKQAYYLISQTGYSLFERCNTLNHMWDELTRDEMQKWVEKSKGGWGEFEKYKLLLSYLEENEIYFVQDLHCCIFRMLFKINAPLPPSISNQSKFLLNAHFTIDAKIVKSLFRKETNFYCGKKGNGNSQSSDSKVMIEM